MRLKPTLSHAFLMLASLSACTKTPNPASDFPSEPRCPSLASKQIWQQNFDGCMTPFRNEPAMKNVPTAQAEASCRCAANGILNAPTCDELNAYLAGNDDYKSAFLQKVTDVCKNHIPALRDQDVKVQN